MAGRLFSRAVDAIKYDTHFYDTGSWTLYSGVQGYNTIVYHQICVALMDQLFALTSDPWFKVMGDMWRAYTPPPGVN